MCIWNQHVLIYLFLYFLAFLNFFDFCTIDLVCIAVYRRKKSELCQGIFLVFGAKYYICNIVFCIFRISEVWAIYWYTFFLDLKMKNLDRKIDVSLLLYIQEKRVEEWNTTHGYFENLERTSWAREERVTVLESQFNFLYKTAAIFESARDGFWNGSLTEKFG